MTKDEIKAAQRIGLALLETIEETGDEGAPEGVLFAAMNAAGCTLSQFQTLLAPLERRGFVKRIEPHLLVLTAEGKTFKNTLATAVGAEAPAGA